MAPLSKEVQSGKTKKEISTPKKEAAPAKVAAAKKVETKTPKTASAPKAPKAVAAPKTDKSDEVAISLGLETRWVNPNELKVNYAKNGRGIFEKALKDSLISQPDSLPSAIAKHGIIFPLVVKKTDKGLELIDGFRRFASMEMMLQGVLKDEDGELLTYPTLDDKGQPKVQIVIVPENYTALDVKLLEIALTSQREWSNLARAEAVKDLRDVHGVSVSEIAKKVGWERVVVSGYLDVMDIPAAKKELSHSGYTNASADAFGDSLQVAILVKDPKKLSDTTIRLASQSAKQIATAEAAARAAKEQNESGEGVPSALVRQGEKIREERNAAAKIEATPEEKSEVFEEIVAEAEKIAETTESGKVTQQVIKEASKVVQEKRGVNAIVERKPTTAPAAPSKPADLSHLKSTLQEVMEALKENPPMGWLEAPADTRENPYVLVTEIILSQVILGKISTEALLEAIYVSDATLKDTAGPESI